MIRRMIAALMLGSVVAFAIPGVSAAQAPATPAGLSAADAAPFMGDWNVTLDSPMGPMAMGVSVKADAGKVSAEVSSEQMGKAPAGELAKQGTSLVLYYSFDFQGQQIPAVLTLTPAAEKVNANLDIAGGAFVATGTAAKATAKP